MRDTGDQATPPLWRQRPAARAFPASASPPFDDVSRIAVLRGGGLGDVLFAEPAMRALASAYPLAEITLLGTPLHAELFRDRRAPLAGVEILPKAEGIPDGEADDAETAEFVERMRSVGFDLGVQVHGGGRFSNPFLLTLGARHTVGLATDDAQRLERTLPYVYYQHEMVRALEVSALAGAEPVSLEPRIEPTARELDRGRGWSTERPLVAVHPGATDPRRRWPVERFADASRRLIEAGCSVVVVGDASDRVAAAAIVEHTRRSLASSVASNIESVAGEQSLSDLVALFTVTDVFLGNDSGPRHLAHAIGVPTVSVYWVGNLINAGPLSRAAHRVHLGWVTTCPVCGRDVTQVGWTAARCQHNDSFVADVEPDAVTDDVLDLMATTPPPHGR